MALLPWRKGKIIRIVDETHNTKRFWIQVPELESFDFKPGQFVTLDLPIHEKPTRRLRSYSIASWPDGTNIFELLIVLNEEGAGTPYLFNQTTIGSELTFRGAIGVFTLPEKIEKDLFFICTGTGIAPFRSMLNHIQLHNIPHQKLFLIFGTRAQKDLLYHDEFIELQKKMNSFQYLPILSRETWEGHTGYVHSVYENLCSHKQESGFFLCGWKNMIDEAKQRIVQLGYEKKAIHQELYG